MHRVSIVTLKFSGRQFPVAVGETVLEAAQRAGVALPYSCRAGVCGSCKATLLEGSCEYPRNPPVALDASALAQHAVLLCQAVPTTDLLLQAREVPSVEDIVRRQLGVVVIDKWRLATDVTGLRLRPERGERRLRRLAGQYLDVVLEDGKHRPFSIANKPQPDGTIELHVRHVTGGGFTSWVDEALAVGDRLRVEGPLGTFVPREDSERPMIFMAGGTGFAPVKAIVEHFIALGTRRSIQLYWGARRASDLYLLPLAEHWALNVPNLAFHPVVSEPGQANHLRTGLVHEAVLQDWPDLSGHDLYMSGPPAMIDTAHPAFLAAGLPEERLYYDSFEYAPDVLAQIIAGRAGIHEG
ncbi:MAG TPA: 2Fe-2S iron-sulfur cluster-binding protein [Rhodanobacter sp.]